MRRLIFILLALPVVACDCGREGGIGAARSGDIPPAPEPPPRSEPARPRFPGYPLVDTSHLGQAPARYAHVVPRLSPPTAPPTAPAAGSATPHASAVRGPSSSAIFWSRGAMISSKRASPWPLRHTPRPVAASSR